MKEVKMITRHSILMIVLALSSAIVSITTHNYPLGIVSAFTAGAGLVMVVVDLTINP